MALQQAKLLGFELDLHRRGLPNPKQMSNPFAKLPYTATQTRLCFVPLSNPPPVLT